jgi:hypothetical protein
MDQLFDRGFNRGKTAFHIARVGCRANTDALINHPITDAATAFKDVLLFVFFLDALFELFFDLFVELLLNL